MIETASSWLRENLSRDWAAVKSPRVEDAFVSAPIAIVDSRKDVIEFFDVAQPMIIDGSARELLMQSDKTQEMVFHPPFCIVWAGSSAHDEGPIAGLGEE